MRFLFVWFVKITGWIPQLIAFRKRIYYQDRSVQSRFVKGGAIIMSNHHRLLDFPLMMYVFITRTVRCLTAEVMYRKNFLMTFLLNALGMVRVERDTHDFTFVSKCCQILNKGGVIGIYPESRLPEKHEEKPIEFKPSVAYIALSSGAPIIPIYINGSYFNFREPSRVIIGTPIDVSAMYDDTLDEKQNLDIITKSLREKVIFLKHELERQTAEEKRQGR